MLKMAIKNSLTDKSTKRTPPPSKLGKPQVNYEEASLNEEEEEAESETISNQGDERENTLDDIEEVKTFYPTEEQFRDPMKYIEYLNVEEGAHKYGIVKIVPPASFCPPLAFDMF